MCAIHLEVYFNNGSKDNNDNNYIDGSSQQIEDMVIMVCLWCCTVFSQRYDSANNMQALLCLLRSQIGIYPSITRDNTHIKYRSTPPLFILTIFKFLTTKQKSRNSRDAILFFVHSNFLKSNQVMCTHAADFGLRFIRSRCTSLIHYGMGI